VQPPSAVYDGEMSTPLAVTGSPYDDTIVLAGKTLLGASIDVGEGNDVVVRLIEEHFFLHF
jgi:hypothetical protein